MQTEKKHQTKETQYGRVYNRDSIKKTERFFLT